VQGSAINQAVYGPAFLYAPRIISSIWVNISGRCYVGKLRIWPSDPRDIPAVKPDR
jgi:hypothetical protein